MGRYRDLDWLNKLMKGKNGADHLVYLMLVLYWPFTLAARYSKIIYFDIPAFLCMAYAFFRFFSANIPKRRAENRKFLEIWHTVTSRILPRKSKGGIAYRYYTCSGCGQNLRVPAGKGMLTIRCPKCKKEFSKKT